MQECRKPRPGPTFTIPIPKGAIGTIIGPKGSNIQRMKQMQGVRNVWVDTEKCCVSVWCNADVADSLKTLLNQLATRARTPVASCSLFVLDMSSEYQHFHFLSTQSKLIVPTITTNGNRTPWYPNGVIQEQEDIDQLTDKMQRIELRKGGFDLYSAGISAPNLKTALSSAVRATSQEAMGLELDLQYQPGQTGFMSMEKTPPLEPLLRNDDNASVFSKLAPVFCEKLCAGIVSRADKALAAMPEFKLVSEREKYVVHVEDTQNDSAFTAIMTESGDNDGAPEFLKIMTDKRKHINLQIIDNVDLLGGRLVVKSSNPLPSLDDGIKRALETAFRDVGRTDGVMQVQVEGGRLYFDMA
eukprot:3816746-Rhodomonas_salina.1